MQNSMDAAYFGNGGKDTLSDLLDEALDDLAEFADTPDDPYQQMMGWITDEAANEITLEDECPPSGIMLNENMEPIAGKIHGVWFKIIDYNRAAGASFGVWLTPGIVCHHVLLDHFDKLPDTAA